eukprot:6183776-Pleurochrysis_carterae.AAC.1
MKKPNSQKLLGKGAVRASAVRWRRRRLSWSSGVPALRGAATCRARTVCSKSIHAVELALRRGSIETPSSLHRVRSGAVDGARLLRESISAGITPALRQVS